MIFLAEREGFEPPIGLHLCRISSAVHSTTLPPLRCHEGADDKPLRSGGVLGEDGCSDKRRGAKIRIEANSGRGFKGGTARRGKNRRSRVGSSKYRAGSAASLARLSRQASLAIASSAATQSPF